MADFFGNVWQVNALMIPAPIGSGEPYLQPVGAVMSLFRHHQGKYAVSVSCGGAVDAVASKTGNKLFLHVVNTDMNTTQTFQLETGGKPVLEAYIYYITSKPETEIPLLNPDCFAVREEKIIGGTVLLPPAAVAAIEITLD